MILESKHEAAPQTIASTGMAGKIKRQICDGFLQKVNAYYIIQLLYHTLTLNTVIVKVKLIK